MSTVAFIEGMISAGFSMEEAIKAARVFEQVQGEASERTSDKPLSKAAERTRRWRERRHEASQTVTGDACDVTTVTDVTVTPPPPLPPSPQTPQPPTPPRENTPLPPKSTSRRKPETPIPDGCPSVDLVEAMQAEARQAGKNVDMAFEARQFRDWWLSKDGRNRDWDACWRTWARKRIANAPKTAVAAIASRAVRSEDDVWRSRLREFRANRHWPTDDAGPRPGAPGCRVPPSILAEMGFPAPVAANDTKPDLFEQGSAA